MSEVEQEYKTEAPVAKPQADTGTYYPVESDKRSDIENRFTYHSPKTDQPQRYVRLRGEAREMALNIIRFTPPSREQSLALTKLEEAIFWANAAIARNEPVKSFTGAAL